MTKKITTILSILGIFLLSGCTNQEYNKPKSCFLGYKKNASIPKNIEDNVVFLVIKEKNQETNTIVGSGFVTKDHHIITAKHLFKNTSDDIIAQNSYGEILGKFEVDSAPTVDETQNFNEQDTISLKYKEPSLSYNDIGYHHFLEKEGLKQENTTSFSFHIEKPFGISGGASGAPILNAKTLNVIGIVSEGHDEPAEHHEEFFVKKLPIFLDDNQSDEYSLLSAPNNNNGISAPLNIDEQKKAKPIKTNIIIPAYPTSHCVAYEGHTQ